MSIDLEKYRAVARRWEHSDNTVAAAAACLIEQLCDGIARLRITDARREAIENAIFLCEATAGMSFKRKNANAWAECAGTLRGLLERHANGGEE